MAPPSEPGLVLRAPAPPSEEKARSRLPPLTESSLTPTLPPPPGSTVGSEEDSNDEDEPWVEETANQCCEHIEATAVAEGVDPPSEELKKQIANLVHSAVKMIAKKKTVVPMEEVLANPIIQWMWRYYDVVLKNCNLGSRSPESCMVSLFVLVAQMDD